MSATDRRGWGTRSIRPLLAVVGVLVTAAILASAAGASGALLADSPESANDPLSLGTAADRGWNSAEAPPSADAPPPADAPPGQPTEPVDASGGTTVEDGVTRSSTWVDDASRGIRVPAALLERRLSAAVMSVTPAVPTDMRIGDAGCPTGEAPPVVETATPVLSARVVIGRAGHVAQFEVAGTDAPADVRWSSGWVPPSDDRSRYAVEVPTGVLGEGDDASYAWRVRSGDGVRTSAWSDWCGFATDVAPRAPVITPVTERVEAIYVAGTEPSGAVGAEGGFVLAPAGSTDVVAYEYDFGGASAPTTVEADSDGTATVSLRPTEAGATVLAVLAVDRAGHRSAPAEHAFVVADASYVADAPYVPWGLMLADPYRSSCLTGEDRDVINSGTPLLSAIGGHPTGGVVEVRFEVAPVGVPGSPVWASGWLTGRISGDSTSTRVPVGALTAGESYSWRAEARWGAVSSGWSPRCEFELDVVGPVKPTMTPITEGVETIFYDGIASGEIGKEGRFLLDTESDDVVSFRVSTNAGTPTTLPADPDGRAIFSYTPSNWYTVHVTVRAIDRAGNLSVATEYRIEPDDTP
ncbi:hypothetical protein [Agromyces arachidis]|uniref:hypothetical protein n=1 Tax=Agromyces arachidis TaxID=766966 RepID=UPI004057C869